MAKLDDKQIRASLIQRLKSQPAKPKAVIEELRVHNGNAIADVVALYKDAHCFEIKGDGDKIERILKQGHYYNLSFRKITLVTTIKHLKKALSISPDFWGIIIAERNDEHVTFKHIRHAKNNSNFSKSLALMTLWKSEMLNLLYEQNSRNKKKSRELLAQQIAKSIKKEELSNHISSLLFNRYQQQNHAT
jgi:hypothetical protein